jgi:hypothetical protein
MKDDNAEFRAVCNQCGLTPEMRRRFSRWLHALKAQGDRGTANARGDFTWDELVDRCEEFKEEQES